MTTDSLTIQDDGSHITFSKYLWLKILIGMGLGVCLGLALSPHGLSLLSADTVAFMAPWIKLPGTIFLGLIQMVVIPLVLCSVILGIAQSGELEFVKKMGLRIVLYFVTTTAIAITIGMALVHLINPGQYIDPSLVENFQSGQVMETEQTQKTFENLTIPERVVNLIPTNIFGAIVEKNLLQIVIASMLIGIALVSMPARTAAPIRNLCVSGQSVAMTVISWAMKMAPYAVFGLLADITMRLGFDALAGMGMYMVTVIAGLLSMLCVYLIIVALVGRMNPFIFPAGRA